MQKLLRKFFPEKKTETEVRLLCMDIKSVACESRLQAYAVEGWHTVAMDIDPYHRIYFTLERTVKK